MTQDRSDRLDRIEAALEQLTTNQLALQQSIQQVDQRLEVSVTELVNMIVQVVEDAEDDRQTFQVEIRRIWEYLRSRNGGSSTP